MAKRETQSARSPTRKQIAVSRKEREQLRLLYTGLGVVAALVLVVLGAGLYQTFVREPNSPVTTVNGTDIATRDYQTRVRYERFMLDQQLQQIFAQRQSLVQSEDQQLAELLVGQYDQQINQLQQQRFQVDRNTLDIMIEDELVETETAQRGITVSEDEVTEAINQFLARQLNGLTEAAASETVTARIEASAAAILWTPTPTFTPSPTLTATEEITPTATPANTPPPAPTPTLNVISAGDLGTQYANWLKILDEGVDVGETEYHQIVRTIVLREKLQEALGSEAPTSAEQAHARHILVETEEEANEIIQRLEAGEEFADLAAELSQDPGSGVAGGDLGFTPSGRFVGPFDEAVFSLPIGEVSEPLETQFGWHVIEVLAREERELTPADYRFSQQLAYRNWLDEARAAATVEDFWSVDKAPEDPLLEGQQP